MKNLNLDALGVTEMEAVEMKKTDGGIWLQLLELIVGAIATDIVMNPSESADAIQEGYNQTSRY